ncbi:SMI1/KNR4 family protein (plasmid) [Streptomyces sp. NBC_00841]|uniref:SMI1/KNR4 family protein n=1 Tax=unclassified Streptomyces TaxID=2593676 RepID=UPI00225001E5|nr:MULTISPECIES: SMI1/KNR4 family protein [unclassified Streptomyces]MCX4538971.1 SMI1/KNR4 family protein [Streptomyces sp. NBC_01669]WSA04797.1 SMI1/KNR4 family protein [Streptomyces sp. NBC_00841]
MDAIESVTALSRLVPTTHGRDEEIDWSEVEAAWPSRFPSDYALFMQTYGAGTFSESVVVLLPTLGVDGYPGGSGLEDETENARYTWEMERDFADFDLDPSSIVAWGVTSGADIYCWVTTDDNPDRWPVLVCGRHTNPTFQLHPFGMVEFLHRVLGDASFQEQTISVVLPEEASFVNWREKQRIRSPRS